MRVCRNRLVYQTQAQEPQSRAFCGLYSINNAMQKVDFISVEEMRAHLARLKIAHPTEDHGDPVNGHYSVKALQQALQSKGYNLLFMNRMDTWQKGTTTTRFKRLAYTKYRRVITIGRPPSQKEGISHCIARVARTVETAPNRIVEKPVLICPDYEEIRECTPVTIQQFLPELQGAYAIVSHAELAEKQAAGMIPEAALF